MFFKAQTGFLPVFLRSEILELLLKHKQFSSGKMQKKKRNIKTFDLWNGSWSLAVIELYGGTDCARRIWIFGEYLFSIAMKKK